MRGVGEAARIMLEKRAVADLVENGDSDLAVPHTRVKTPTEISGPDEPGDAD